MTFDVSCKLICTCRIKTTNYIEVCLLNSKIFQTRGTQRGKITRIVLPLSTRNCSCCAFKESSLYCRPVRISSSLFWTLGGRLDISESVNSFLNSAAIFSDSDAHSAQAQISGIFAVWELLVHCGSWSQNMLLRRWTLRRHYCIFVFQRENNNNMKNYKTNLDVDCVYPTLKMV